jgi:hypothetical protein
MAFALHAGGLPYPVMDGPSTVSVFLNAADAAYAALHHNLRQRQQGEPWKQQSGAAPSAPDLSQGGLI